MNLPYAVLSIHNSNAFA
jgi:hypothetical protein